LFGAPVFVAFGPGTALATALAGANGVASLAVPGPLPAGLAGLTFWVQGGWVPPGGCVPLLTSDAIACTVR
jgi:hypothetical protein